MFGELKREWSAKQGAEVDVFVTDKYKESRAKAIEIIESKKYGVTEADFWILKNETKSGKIAYAGLIISHNGCLKINDRLETKFDPESVTVDTDGWGSTLVAFYRNAAQGLFEVGEVSAANCKNAYPYAMCVKRLFDRVVLKLSKLAYAGIYGEDEADEFRRSYDEKKDNTEIVKGILAKTGKKASDVKRESEALFGKPIFVKDMDNEQFEALCERLKG